MDNAPLTIDFASAEVERRRRQVSSPTAVFDIRVNDDQGAITFTKAGVNLVVPDADFAEGEQKNLGNYSLVMLHWLNASNPICLIFVPKGDGIFGNKGMKGGRVVARKFVDTLRNNYCFPNTDTEFCLVRVNDWEGFPCYGVFKDRNDLSSFTTIQDEDASGIVQQMSEDVPQGNPNSILHATSSSSLGATQEAVSNDTNSTVELTSSGTSNGSERDPEPHQSQTEVDDSF